MTVLLLDPRWPMMIPLDAFGPDGKLPGPVTYTWEVPMSVRWHLGDLAGEPLGTGVLVSTNEQDDAVRERVAHGERVVEAASRSDAVGRAVKLMQRAQDIGEWERAQTHETLLPYLEEEAQEFADAVRAQAGDAELKKELGDVLLQVLFHAEIAARRGAFDFADVAESFVKKMASRAPYLFDGTDTVVDTETQDRLWAEGKARERREAEERDGR
ncbi:nucleoside triphosphate hydrolase [Corynebacterium incognita]|uniref:Nucleoside triphosphate hydrolase n=1 Tax=Corynebacterium incognita TaxID=2754725 RepID=A0A7G7CNT7_9CORY|nr:MazG nucleotide pyrophosphohydrolase domain-containing protein [Corynebacterium incognita]QNE89253.1 nucleoside triphosphate hydrolase [Corynebacterium incognita]